MEVGMTMQQSSDIKNRNIKIGKVLLKFLEPNFKVKNDVYLNLFLTHLLGKSNDKKNSDHKLNITDEQKLQFTQWLIDATNLWNNKHVTPPSVILSFGLNLGSQLSGNEQIFVKLNCQNVYESLVCIAQKCFNNDASVTLGFVSLLCSFFEHKSGVHWILATNYWIEIVDLAIKAHTMYIKKKSYEFVAKLLTKTISFNRNFCLNLTNMLIRPLKEPLKKLPSVLDSGQQNSVKNSSLFEMLKPNLIFITDVLEILIKNTESIKVLELFIELKLGEIIEKLLLLSQLEDFSFELIKIRCIILFAKLGKQSLTKHGELNQLTQDSSTLFDIKIMFDIISGEMDKDHVKCVIKICHYAHQLYYSLATKIPLCFRKGEPIEFQNQMVLFQLIPVMVFFCTTGISREVMLGDSFRQDFIHKLVKISALRTLDICFRWKLRLETKPDLIEDMIFGLQYMIKSKNLLNKERASLFFQPLVYALKDSITILKSKEGNIDMIAGCDKFLFTLIESIIDLVNSFDLTWRDSIETISVMSIACEMLQFTIWEPKILIALLKLLNLSISKYMSPDMVLLLDNSEDSVVSRTGSLLYAQCHNNNWEVRDTALECVHTLSITAKSNFPSHTNVLVEADLPKLIFTMALNDGEFYVRSTAFRCLQELIQINSLWDGYVEDNTFFDRIINVFENETEGIVRKEAATLIFNIFKYQLFPEDFMPRLYNVMTHAAVADLHWEVKQNALDFWFHVFKIHLVNQGMIDNAFPSVTFSKEHRKIVTLNELEVRKRLIKVLNELSKIGCLYVIKCACLDDCDIEVARKSTRAASWLNQMFKLYHVPCDSIDASEPPDLCSNISSVMSNLDTPSGSSSVNLAQNSNNPFSPFSFTDVDFSLYSPSPDANLLIPNNEENLSVKSNLDPSKLESIMDELLSSDDLTFLQKLYDPNDSVKKSTCEMRKATYLAPTEFLKFIYQHAEKSASEKTQWLNSLDEFDSLLDDILKEYNVNVPDINNMDCY